jgi:ribonuclease III
MNEDLTALQSALGHQFSRPELLELALTHSSRAYEEAKATGQEGVETFDNEQFEFLGDAVLGLVASHLLFERFPNWHEGQLSKLKAHLVSARHLVGVGVRINLGQYLRLGRGEERSGGRTRSALISDAMEAVIAALYLDAGLEKARAFIITEVLEPELKRIGAENDGDFTVPDYKSELQELLQSSGGAQPLYVTVREEGPDHRKIFTVEVRVNPRGINKSDYVARAEGDTKKKAEKLAAQQALEYLRAQPADLEPGNE